MRLLEKRYQEVRRLLPRQCAVIERSLGKLNEQELRKANEAFLEGKSGDYVKEEFLAKPKRKEQTEEERLLEEKKRLERTIRNLEKRLAEVNRRLEQ